MGSKVHRAADYIVCPLCPNCKYFSMKKGSTHPYVCDKGSTATAHMKANAKISETFNNCKCWEQK